MKSLSEPLFVLALVAGALILQEVVHVSPLSIGLTFAAIALGVGVYVASDYWFGRRIARRLPWLLHLENGEGLNNLRELEASVQNGSFIYLISPDLYNDALNTPTIAVVCGNLARGVQYRYITQKTDDADINISLARRNFSDYISQLKFYQIDDLFSKLPLSSNILILENRHGDSMPEAYFELPFEEKNRRLYWCRTDALTARRWHSLLVRLTDQTEPVPSKPTVHQQTGAVARQECL